ncbi:MAG: tRNA (N6-threonylcarbamoyladenosine(37)-N6)-methyltransferase TrmO [Anaerolineae bacterium]|jgi:tRNA-Thr(GGU) m(6)t(6)A37 methyltransferase TsaA
MSDRRELMVRPIGRVSHGRPRGPAGEQWAGMPSQIEIDPPWDEALEGIGEFSHIWVMWWIDGFDEPPTSPRVRPEGRDEMPLVGLFATRSPHRPNPIGLTAVRLLGHNGARLRVEGLDAYQDTPVLDIKPYLWRGDRIPEAEMPEWLEDLWQRHDEERASK